MWPPQPVPTSAAAPPGPEPPVAAEAGHLVEGQPSALEQTPLLSHPWACSRDSSSLNGPQQRTRELNLDTHASPPCTATPSSWTLTPFLDSSGRLPPSTLSGLQPPFPLLQVLVAHHSHPSSSCLPGSGTFLPGSPDSACPPSPTDKWRPPLYISAHWWAPSAGAVIPARPAGTSRRSESRGSQARPADTPHSHGRV